MSRFLLALRCFFAVLFYFRLPRDAVALLPPPDLTLRPGLAPPEHAPVDRMGSRPEGGTSTPEGRTSPPEGSDPSPKGAILPPKDLPAPAKDLRALSAPSDAPATASHALSAAKDASAGPTHAHPDARDALATLAPALAGASPEALPPDELRRRGAVQMLAMLQREGRLIDFLMEDVESYGDAQIGAAVRDIHRGCRKGLLEHVQVAAVRPEPDEAAVRVEEGYDPSAVRLIGTITGRPPFHGTLRHHGWRARGITLPDLPPSHDAQVITPAEVELGG